MQTNLARPRAKCGVRPEYSSVITERMPSDQIRFPYARCGEWQENLRKMGAADIDKMADLGPSTGKSGEAASAVFEVT